MQVDPTSERTSLVLGNERYLLCPTDVYLGYGLPFKSAVIDGFIPVTAIPWDRPVFRDIDLDNICQAYGERDDVWCKDFLSAVVLLNLSPHECITESKFFIHMDNLVAQLPAGPLMVNARDLQVYLVAKCMLDPQAAFVGGVIPFPGRSSRFAELSRLEQPLVPCPSRLYFRYDAQKPLKGLRIAVKDTIALEGLKTGYGNKAWETTYGPEISTASCVRRLIDAGAVIVGKAKTSEFAEGTDPCEWTLSSGWLCPYNPRGDGQQKPSSSSTGSAAAVASYDWLDAAIGTDTGGSIRHVAGVTGLYGQRPSTGICELDGVRGATPLFNTVGVMARSVDILRRVGSVLVGIDLPGGCQPRKKNKRYRLLFPTRASPKLTPGQLEGQQKWFPHPSVDPEAGTEAELDFEQVVRRIEMVLDCRRIPFNVDELWASSSPEGQPKSLDDAVSHIYATITTYGALHSGIGQFIQDYTSLNEGEEPRIAQIVQERLEYGSKVTPEQIEACIKAKQAFKDWLEKTLLPDNPAVTTIMLTPNSFGTPSYRDERPDRSQLFNNTFSIYAFGYLGGCPDYTIPISDVPFVSKHTGEIEYLPASLSLIGRPGADLELFEVVEELHRNGVISDVMTGSRMFPQRG